MNSKDPTKNCKDEQQGPHQKLRVKQGKREGQTVPTSYKTNGVSQYIYIVNSDKSIVGNRGKKNST